MADEIKEIRINAKCSDMFAATLHDKTGKQIGGMYAGYVPSIMPGQHFGDYVELDIELSTGKILNWKSPSKKAIAEFQNQCTRNF
jgi:hypothetical protein